MKKTIWGGVLAAFWVQTSVWAGPPASAVVAPVEVKGIQLAAPDFRVMPGGNAALYLTVENLTGEDDELLSAELAGAHVSLHETVHVKDVARMVEAKSFPVPAKSKLMLQPGGKHVMIMGARDLVPGKEVTLTLQFRKAGKVPIRVIGAGPLR